MDRKRIEGLPVWMLTPKEEKEVFEEYIQEVYKECDDYVKAFSACEQMTGFGVFFKCRKESKAMKSCVQSHYSQEFVDEVRDKYIEKKIAFRKNLEETERAAKKNSK